MENIKFLGAANEVQKIYNDLGLFVPVGDLSQGKAPGFKVYEVKYNEDGEDSAVNATIQIYCNSEGSGVCALYKTSDIEELFPNGVPTDYDLDAAINDPESQDPIKGKTYYAYDVIPFRKDMYTLSMQTTGADHAPAALPYDDYTLIMSIYSVSGGVTTVTSQFSAVAPPNWATPDEVLNGNKYIGEDGEEHVGEYVPEEAPDGLSYLGIPVFEYSVSEDPETGENVIDYARLVEGSHAHASEWTAAGLGDIDSYQIWYRWTTNDGNGNIDGSILETHLFDSIDNPEATYVDLSSVLDADALANDTYFLEAYEIIRYNGIEYATESTTYPTDVYEGSPVIETGELYITDNGYADVTGYSEVTVDVAPTDGGYSIESITYTQHIGGDPQAPSGLDITWTNAPEFTAEEAEELGYKATVLIENIEGSLVPVDYCSCCGTPEYSYGSIIIANEIEYSYDAFAAVDPDPDNDPVSDKNAKVVIYTNDICSPTWVIPAIYNPTPQP